MLKYENIISRLNESAKIDILTNIQGLGERELITMGLPPLKSGVLSKMTQNIFPSPALLANSWNEELVESVASASAAHMAYNGVALALTPPAAIKLNPYRSAISEDVHLSATISAAYASGVKKAGLMPSVSGLGIEADETAWTDRPADARIIYEYVVKPYKKALELCGSPVGVRENIHVKGYEELNQALARQAAEGKIHAGSLSVCDHLSAENTVKYINYGIICLQGAGYALQAALRKYVNVKRAVDRGEMREEELLREVACGTAISPEMLDLAVDRMIDFITACGSRYVGEQEALVEIDSVAERAVRESVVLLKNEGRLLPISKRTKVALIGDICVANEENVARITEKLSEIGATVIGAARGYNLKKDIPDNELRDQAFALAKSADVVLFFVGTDEAREAYITRSRNLSLPANQDILAEELAHQYAKKTVAVLTSNYSVDIASLESLGAVLLAPLFAKASCEAIADIVSGRVNPSGRLASSLYRNTDRSLQKQQNYLKNGVRAGRFIGYRYYDTANYNIGYAFGHGLGYSSFSYSSLSVESNTKVSLNVRNTSRMAGYEVVQVYAGIKHSAEIRPKKELVAFKKVFLEPGKSQRVTLEFSLPEIFDQQSGAFVLEKGDYVLYVGSSVKDIRLTTTLRAGDAELVRRPEPLSRYLQSESNIISENYTLEAKYPIMKKAIKNIFSGVAMLLLAVLLQVYCVATNTSSAFLNILTVAILVVGVAFFIIEAIDRKRMSVKESEAAAAANEKWFEDASKLEELDADKMFADEFDNREESYFEEHEEEAARDHGDEYFAYIDRDFTFEAAAAELEQFALERGCKMDRSNICSLLASMSSSRLVVVNGLASNEFEKLATIISEYFDSTPYIDKIDKTYTNGARTFYRTDSSGNKVKTGVLRAIEDAAKDVAVVRVAAIAGAGYGVMETCFADIVKYAKNPLADSVVSSIEEKYRFSQNLWFMIALDGAKTLNDIPTEVAQVAAFTELKLTLTAPASSVGSVHKIKYYQMDYMCDRVARNSEVDESVWKKVDKLEDFVGKYAEYSIGNKQWLSMEKYVAVFTACAGDMTDAVDRAVAARLVPSIVSTAFTTEKGAQMELSEEMEKIFGENNVDLSRRIVRNAELNRTVKNS